MRSICFNILLPYINSKISRNKLFDNPKLYLDKMKRGTLRISQPMY